MTAHDRRIGITMGDPSGVGPEIVLKALASMGPRMAADACGLVVVGTPGCMMRTASELGMDITLTEDGGPAIWPRVSLVTAGETDGNIVPGVVSAEAGRLAFLAIERSVNMALSGAIDAIVTAPINKAALHAAGYHYVGHTDMLKDLTGSADVCMMLSHERLRVSHVCDHVPLSEVPGRVTKPRVRRVVQLTLDAMRDLGFPRPITLFSLCLCCFPDFPGFGDRTSQISCIFLFLFRKRCIYAWPDGRV